MTGDLLIVGAGGHARKLSYYAEALGWRVGAFIDDDPAARAPRPGASCVSMADALAFPPGQHFIVAIGDPVARRRLLERFQAMAWVAPALVHPSAYVAPDVVLGAGTVVCAHAVVETGSVIGVGVIVDIGVMLDHNCVVAMYSHVKTAHVYPPGTRIGGHGELY
ncbi:MAG TPA: hypothetical protein DCW29_00800 [Janthinobacterium sp.]|nr:hypothetical protein [Janthinobacterium sp.]